MATELYKVRNKKGFKEFNTLQQARAYVKASPYGGIIYEKVFSV